MSYGKIKYAVILGLAGAIVALGLPRLSQASLMVAPGFDLFETDGAQFGGVQFVGVPFGSFNFPGIGVRNTGTTDTIIQRLPPAASVTPPPPPLPKTAAPIPIEIVGLQLVSVTAFDPPGPSPLDRYSVTLQLGHAPVSGDNLTITFGPEPHGAPPSTFTSVLTVPVDFRHGVDNFAGPVDFSDTLEFRSVGNVVWSHTPAPGALLLDREGNLLPVNRFLAGMNDESQDFWPVAFSECTPTADCHPVRPARKTPEPGSVLLLGIGILAAAGCRWLRRKDAA